MGLVVGEEVRLDAVLLDERLHASGDAGCDRLCQGFYGRDFGE